MKLRILLQFPEGLKQEALKHAQKLEAEGHQVFISASPTFGACDLALDEARNLKVDKLVHFGHAEFHKVDFNVEYIPYYVEAPLTLLPASLEQLAEFKTISLVTTIQHIHQLPKIREFYEAHGKAVVIGKPFGFAKNPGQILGCDIGSAATVDKQVDAHVYFGGGMFHPLGALLNTTKPFFVIEPFNGTVERIDRHRETYRKRSRGKIMASLKAQSVGILVSTKNGQHNMNLAGIIKSKAEAAGLAAEILVANTFDFTSLDNMLEFECFVNTACPRLAVDDPIRTRSPILSANEFMEVLRMKAELKAKALA